MGKSYLAIFRMEFKGELQYRAKAISGIITQLFWGFLQIFLYRAFLNSGSVDGFSIIQMASYVWLGQALIAMRMILPNKKVAANIVNGNICYNFVRPINLYNQWYVSGIGQKLASVLLRFPLIILIAAFLPSGYGLSAPASVAALFTMLLALALGFCMTVAIEMFATYLTFITMSPKGCNTVIATISGLLGGLVIPLPLMPQSLQNIINYLPFRFISDLPLRIYIGNVDVKEGLMFIGIGLAWLIFLIIVGKLLIRKALKKTIIQGG